MIAVNAFARAPADRVSARRGPGPRGPSPSGIGASDRLRRLVSGVALCLAWLSPAGAEELPEYRLKAAFLYNFALYTEWPADVGSTLNLCIYGDDPFGAEVDALNGKRVGSRIIAVQRVGKESLNNCQIVFVAQSALASSARVLEPLRSAAMLTVADSTDSARRGVALNMAMGDAKISFEVNMKALGPRLALSSKLLRLARDIQQ
ncbi:MAG: YfiR family protein [Caldimonas sp.]